MITFATTKDGPFREDDLKVLEADVRWDLDALAKEVPALGVGAASLRDRITVLSSARCLGEVFALSRTHLAGLDISNQVLLMKDLQDLGGKVHCALRAVTRYKSQTNCVTFLDEAIEQVAAVKKNMNDYLRKS